jgi:hypothetical protein
VSAVLLHCMSPLLARLDRRRSIVVRGKPDIETEPKWSK